ncbi:hypothetical protein EXIGLDRAFT_56400 [Exidia glandulosa HHB12029]|uniref:polynucleotide adenylyltransferase n=1 Tax=Exidia glandulosa HHB12029 TaxID=1314781 RepID=A0A165I799_EXIGL|nr:hypothetical protein EXIGLDRAFT_56400 [Exidia glandulosa HHB12029]
MPTIQDLFGNSIVSRLTPTGRVNTVDLQFGEDPHERPDDAAGFGIHRSKVLPHQELMSWTPRARVTPPSGLESESAFEEEVLHDSPENFGLRQGTRATADRRDPPHRAGSGTPSAFGFSSTPREKPASSPWASSSSSSERNFRDTNGPPRKAEPGRHSAFGLYSTQSTPRDKPSWASSSSPSAWSPRRDFSTSCHAAARQRSATAMNAAVARSLPRQEEEDEEQGESWRELFEQDDYPEDLDEPIVTEDRMDVQLWKYYNSKRPNKTELEARKEALYRIRSAVHAYAGLRCDVEPFGSTLIGVDEGRSDLDLVVLDPHMPEGFMPHIKYQKEPTKLYNVSKLSRFFYKRGFRNTEAIPAATVPILRAVVPTKPEIPFDLSVNARNGLFNSRLVAAYATLHPYVRPMIVILKAFARNRGIDAPARVIRRGRKQHGVPRPFSSYIMGLLVVAYLQRIGMLPNLQEPFAAPIKRVAHEHPPLGDDDVPLEKPYDPPPLRSDGSSPQVWWTIGRKDPELRIPSDTRFLDPTSEPVQEWVQARHAYLAANQREEITLKETLEGFFYFWGRTFMFNKWAVSIRDGGIVDRLQPPAYQKPERFLAEFERDMINGDHPEADSTVTDEYEREGESPETDMRIDRQLAMILDTPTNMDAWKSNSFVVVDPIVRTNNLTQSAPKHALQTFVGQCSAAHNILRLGLGIDDLLHAKPSLTKREKKAVLMAKVAEQRREAKKLPKKPETEEERDARISAKAAAKAERAARNASKVLEKRAAKKELELERKAKKKEKKQMKALLREQKVAAKKEKASAQEQRADAQATQQVVAA